MDKLARLNAHPRDAHVVFHEAGHVYEIHGSATHIVSATTFIKQFATPFDADKVIRKMKQGKSWGPEHKYFGMTDAEIKAEWSATGKSASESGTAMHANIEATYNDVEVEDTSPEFLMFQQFRADHAHLVPYRTEWVVYSEELRIAGSIDMVFRNEDGTLSIYDWKRSKEIKFRGYDRMRFPLEHLHDINFVHYSLQLNLYKWILETYYEATVRDLYLIVMHPDQSSYQKIACMDLQTEITDLMELRRLQMRDRDEI